VGKKTKPKPGKNNIWLIVGGAAVMTIIVWATLNYTRSGSEPAVAGNSDKPPITLIATMDPQSFSGRARVAYQVAKDIPEILVQLPCFCGCRDGLGHKNNLYCFADNHGNICDMCQSIALDAQEMHRKGLPIEQIRSNIRNTYAQIQ